MAQEGKPTLTYLKLHGKAEQIRLLLAAANAEFNDIRLSFEEWPAFKATLTGPKQVPLWTTTEGKTLNQGNAILRTLGRQYGFYNDLTAEEYFLVDWALETSLDLSISRAYRAWMNDLSEEETAAAVASFGTFNSEIAAKLSETGKNYFAGDKLTIADFTILAHYLQMPQSDSPKACTASCAALVAETPVVGAYLERVKAHVADYLAARASHGHPI